MELSSEQVQIRKDMLDVAEQIASRNDRILKAIHSQPSEEKQLAMFKKLLQNLEYFHRKNFIYAGKN